MDTLGIPRQTKIITKLEGTNKFVYRCFLLPTFTVKLREGYENSPAAKQSKLVGLRKVVVEPSNLVCSLLISIEFNSVEEPIRKMMR